MYEHVTPEQTELIERELRSAFISRLDRVPRLLRLRRNYKKVLVLLAFLCGLAVGFTIAH